MIIEADRVPPKPDLKTASSLKIGYVIRGSERQPISVSDVKDVRSILEALEVKGTYKGVFAGAPGILSVSFQFPDGVVVETRFAGKEQLARDGWGAVHISPKFYEKISEIVSKAEGRPVDVLKEN